MHKSTAHAHSFNMRQLATHGVHEVIDLVAYISLDARTYLLSSG